MTNPLKAATIQHAFGSNFKPLYIVNLDQDAAEIMGETKLQYMVDTLAMAEWIAQDLQSTLDELHDESCE